jgi:hypothetical protein
MKLARAALNLTVAGLALTGCISHIGVTKVQPGKNPRGLRYFLPEPIIVGRPQPDGGIVYTVEMLQDPEHEYAIDSWSFMANHTAKMTRSPEMFLTKAELSQDTTAVARQLLTSAGGIGAELATQIGAEKTAERKAQSDAAAARAVSRAAAQKAIQDAQDKVTLAQDAEHRAEAELTAAEATNDPAAVKAARSKLAQAQADLEVAERQLQFATRNADRLDDPAATRDAAAGPVRGLAAGPIVYRIVEDRTSHAISLVPIEFKLGYPRLTKASVQRRFQTVKIAARAGKAEPKAGATEIPGELHLRGEVIDATIAAPTGLKVLLEDCQITRDSDRANVTDQFKLATSSDGRKLVVTRTTGTKLGRYRVKLVVKDSAAHASQRTETLIVE